MNKVILDVELFKPKEMSKDIIEPHPNFAPQVAKCTLKLTEEKKNEFVAKYDIRKKSTPRILCR